MKSLTIPILFFLLAILIAIAQIAIELGIIWLLLKLILIGFGVNLLGKYWIIAGIIFIVQALIGFTIKAEVNN